jgi:GNAT superfamily N-acetyltransferase
MTTRQPGPPIHYTAGAVEVVERAYDQADAVHLVASLFDEQVHRYGFADPVDADPAVYRPPLGLFLVAYIAGVPGACGGYRPYDPGAVTVEIKKLYTVPTWRGRGLGRLVLTLLEEDAARRGAHVAVLETGVRNHAALALFQRAGYSPTAQYVNGRDPNINRAFIKEIPGAEKRPEPGASLATG